MDSDPDGDAIEFVSHGNPSNGTVDCDDNGICTYTPNEDYNGVDTFNYLMADFRAAGDSAIVTITIIAVNEPPKPKNDEVTTLEEESVTINIFANDGDPDGEIMTLVRFHRDKQTG